MDNNLLKLHRQPKPARVVQDAPRTGRKVKHKETLEQVIERGE
jgi:hypothetical protein